MCKQEGCPCKDPRVLSYRTMRLVRYMAAKRGQTADRVITSEPLRITLRSDLSEAIGL